MEWCPKKAVRGGGHFSLHSPFSTNRWGLPAFPTLFSLLPTPALNPRLPPASLFLSSSSSSFSIPPSCPFFTFPLLSSLIYLLLLWWAWEEWKFLVTTLPSSAHLYYLRDISWNKGCLSSLPTCSLTRDATHTGSHHPCLWARQLTPSTVLTLLSASSLRKNPRLGAEGEEKREDRKESRSVGS